MDCLFFIETSLAGLPVGAIYSLVALGFVIIYKATKVINFAIGEIMMISAYLFLTFTGILEWHPFVALPLAVIGGGLLDGITEKMIIRPMLGESSISVVMITIGLSSILIGAAQIIWGPGPRILPDFLPRAPIFIGELYVSSKMAYSALIAVIMLTCYLLYSIPLFGTHLALAGYADIWMAGFSGLGFIALIRGTINHQETGKPDAQMVLGFLMIIFAIWVKNEGAVWFLAALAMLILATCRPRVPILMMVGAIVIALAAFALGITHIDLPLIGKLGLVDDHLTIPFIGNFVLEAHDIRNVYWENFIAMGSWNLLWVMVAAGLLLGFRSPNLFSGYRARRAALSFILIFLATQVFIFGFTDRGLWADTYTAINRLPLHFVPALLFALVVIAHASLTENETGVQNDDH